MITSALVCEATSDNKNRKYIKVFRSFRRACDYVDRLYDKRVSNGDEDFMLEAKPVSDIYGIMHFGVQKYGRF